LRFAISGQFSQSPDAVFAQLSNFEGVPSWQDDTLELHRDVSHQNLRLHSMRTSPFGKVQVTSEIIEFDAARRMYSERLLNTVMAGSTFQWSVAPTAAGSVVTVDIDLILEGQFPAIPQEVSQMVGGRISEALGQLKARLDSEEPGARSP
jgi:hypothetical protein